jgi:queuine tRNA-ribosyltransferase accessory subunit
MAPAQLEQLPHEMFTVIKQAAAALGPRLGRLALPGRHAIETPHYLGITSRGVVPHLTQDTFVRDTAISGVYLGLEDCKSALIPRSQHAPG